MIMMNLNLEVFGIILLLRVMCLDYAKKRTFSGKTKLAVISANVFPNVNDAC